MEKTRIDHLIEMLKEDPEDSFLNYALALEYEKKGELNEAIKKLVELKSKNHNYLPTYYLLGKLLEMVGEFEQASKAYEGGIIIAKKQGDQKIEGELKEALSLLEDSL